MAVIERIRDARLLGVEKDTDRRYSGQRSWHFDVQHRGFRYHMSNIMAAIGREQLKKLPQFSERRAVLSKKYRQVFQGMQGVQVLDFANEPEVPHIFVIRIPAPVRAGLILRLNEFNIEVGTPYAPNHLLSLFKVPYQLPVAEKLGQQLLSLPLHPLVTDADQDQVLYVVSSYLQEFCNAGSLCSD
jgi:dTDP-4-amino-4,6-dideoxygalactose transaminase